MRSNYKKLGNYIRQVSARNKDLAIDSPMGININKLFMPSVANTVGTDLSKYRVVSKNQFAYNPMHVGRDEALPIAFLQSDKSIIVSPAYVIFEVVDPQELDPEYLMMWCRRPEFDRNAWFTTDNTVRGGFSWGSMCDMKLPIPSIEKQRETVKEYNAVVNRINLNEQLNKKLEETAQALYKYWFVDFEFPNEEGRPYKASGGEMVYNEELDKEIPKEWGICPFTQIVKIMGGGTPSTSVTEFWNDEVPFYTPGDLMKQYYALTTSKSISILGLEKCSSRLYPANTTFLTARGATVGGIAIPAIPMAMNQTCYALCGIEANEYFVHQLSMYTIKSLKREAIGATFEALVTKDFEQTTIIRAKKEIIKEFGKQSSPIYSHMLANTLQNKKLCQFKDLLLSKITEMQLATMSY